MSHVHFRSTVGCRTKYQMNCQTHEFYTQMSNFIQKHQGYRLKPNRLTALSVMTRRASRPVVLFFLFSTARRLVVNGFPDVDLATFHIYNQRKTPIFTFIILLFTFMRVIIIYLLFRLALVVQIPLEQRPITGLDGLSSSEFIFCISSLMMFFCASSSDELSFTQNIFGYDRMQRIPNAQILVMSAIFTLLICRRCLDL